MFSYESNIEIDYFFVNILYYTFLHPIRKNKKILDFSRISKYTNLN